MALGNPGVGARLSLSENGLVDVDDGLALVQPVNESRSCQLSLQQDLGLIHLWSDGGHLPVAELEVLLENVANSSHRDSESEFHLSKVLTNGTYSEILCTFHIFSNEIFQDDSLSNMLQGLGTSSQESSLFAWWQNAARMGFETLALL